MLTPRPSTSTCRRLLRPAVLLAGLLASEGFAASTEEQTLTAIARRSFGATEALDIARRSLGESGRKPVATTRRRIALQPSPGRTRRPPLDAARLERTARYRELIEHHSRLNHVDAALVQAIVYTESGGNAMAVSSAGARGLMQLMPATADDLGVTDPLNRLTIWAIFLSIELCVQLPRTRLPSSCPFRLPRRRLSCVSPTGSPRNRLSLRHRQWGLFSTGSCVVSSTHRHASAASHSRRSGQPHERQEHSCSARQSAIRETVDGVYRSRQGRERPAGGLSPAGQVHRRQTRHRVATIGGDG
ncbi:MAG: hypothetical protein CME04_02925 [Gemmatimonadaceae bacterium]|nr:hypothetical protein [Gemmatimonadaceae bacterium]